MKKYPLQQRVLALSLLLLSITATTGLSAQSIPRADNPSKAVPASRSQAEKEADSLVALSADKIVSLLTQEPGLLLVCKKMLVYTAYEQGRVLDPDDLTDDAVYRLVREDQNVRVLFTQEIVNRYYIRVKPTREELEKQERLVRQGVIQPNPQDLQKGAAAGDLKSTSSSQEDKYWDLHENDWQRMLPQFDYSAPNSPQRATPGQRTEPQTPQPMSPDIDERREVDRAGMQDSDGFEIPADSGNMPRISPDQLSSLLDTSASLNNPGLAGGGAMGGDPSSTAKGLGDNLSGSGLGAQGLSDLPPTGSQNTNGLDENAGRYPQQASLSTRRQRITSPPDGFEPPALRHRPNPYADVPSLYDLYAQYQRRSPKLERFGANIFQNGTGNTDRLPIDLPAGPDYVLGPGDGVTIDLSGSVSERI